MVLRDNGPLPSVGSHKTIFEIILRSLNRSRRIAVYHFVRHNGIARQMEHTRRLRKRQAMWNKYKGLLGYALESAVCTHAHTRTRIYILFKLITKSLNGCCLLDKGSAFDNDQTRNLILSPSAAYGTPRTHTCTLELIFDLTNDDIYTHVCGVFTRTTPRSVEISLWN